MTQVLLRLFLFLGGFEMELIRKTGRKLNKSGKSKQSYGLFLCSYCNKEVERGLGNGKTHQSCGCVRYKLIAKALVTHGDSKNGHTTKLYSIWASMKNRCYNENDSAYGNYGGRRIKICKEWKNDYKWFKKWAINNGYRNDLTIDRIDNDGNYKPENCKWSTVKEQNRNTRSNRMITYKGKTHCIAEWVEILRISRSVLYDRLYTLGWSVERAFTQKVRKYQKRSK